ncbi:MAG: hypothetical protein ACXV4B_08510 [Halobacteriota archaeon]
MFAATLTLLSIAFSYPRAAFLHIREVSDHELREIAKTTVDAAEITAVTWELSRRSRVLLGEGQMPNVLPLRKR